MVAYLQKSEGSEWFHQIIDFLNASNIQYALTVNPTIYVFFIKQFWKTATARTNANGEVELTATINGQVKTITEASLRIHLKLKDNGGVTTLPNSEIFEQLALMGAPETSPSRITSSPSLSPQHTPVSTPSTLQPPNTQPTPNIEEAVPMPRESPLHSVHSLGRDEGSLSLSELTVLCTNLSNKVTSLEAELAQTKQTYGTVLTKLIKKVKKLEQTVKSTQARRRFKIVIFDDEEEHSTIIPEVSTVAANLVYIRRSAQKRKDKGKEIMQESEPPNKVKKRVQVQMSMDEELAKKVFKEEQAKAIAEQEQERINFEAALELQKQLDKREEVAAIKISCLSTRH
ncbi:hypothetical protein Tco_0294713 [Tanacetum coccineum]